MNGWLITAAAIGVAIVGLVIWACSQNAIVKEERRQRRFRKWLKENTPDGKEPPHIP